MGDDFKLKTKFYAELFGVAQTTLNNWVTSDDRATHRELISLAAQAIEMCPVLKTHLETPSDELEQLAEQLGIDNPLNVPIEGLSLRTWRSWFQTPKRARLTAGFLLGMHWQAIATLANASGKSIDALLSKFDRKGITPSRVVRLYRIDPQAVTVLIAN